MWKLEGQKAYFADAIPVITETMPSTKAIGFRSVRLVIRDPVFLDTGS